MSLLQHLQECADESGEELLPNVTLNGREVEYAGRTIEVYYNEHRCRWYAFVYGIGETTGGIQGDEQGAIDAMKAKIDKAGPR
jgi:hypothetical protein